VKILGCTSIRSDYDLLSPLYSLLKQDDNIDFRLVVSGAHLSDFHGKTLGQIVEDDFDILCKIETIKSNEDSKASRLRSVSILLSKLIDEVVSFAPDLVLFSGDREDVLAYSTVGAYLGIPTIHFYSGDHARDGYVDNPVRHACSKLSSAHFVCLEEHARRLVAMGESKNRVFQVGSIALDRFCNFTPLSFSQIQKKLCGETAGLEKDYCLVIFHPLSEEIENSSVKFEFILRGLKTLGIQGVVSFPNSDPNNFKIRDVISKYSSDPNFIFYENLDRDLFLSIYKKSQFIIGNSSSGILEAASIPIPAINVGERQKGRLAGENVIFIDGNTEEDIIRAILEVKDSQFLKKIESIENPYGNGDSAKKAYELIKTIDFSSLLLKKEDALEVSNE
jgi:UDP-hydrolysing UDP-N-acetyl-D-glucosamine 2-epimerase